MFDEPTLTTLIAGLPLAAIQLRPGHSQYNKALCRWQENLWVEAILTEPGWDHGRYRLQTLVRVFDPDPDAIHAVAAAVTTLPIHVMDERGAGWIARQPAGPPQNWTISWEAVLWRPDGCRVLHSGQETVSARAGKAASAAAQGQVFKRLDPDGQGILRLKTALTLAGHTHRTHHSTVATRPTGLPEDSWLRKRARGGERPSEMLRLHQDATPLALMQALADAFSLSLDVLAPVGAWQRGELPAARMDPEISAHIQGNELKWGLGWLLSGAWHRKEPMRKTMLAYKARGVGTIQMIIGLREAFRFSLRYGKEIVSMCCSAHSTDAEFEARFRECVAASA